MPPTTPMSDESTRTHRQSQAPPAPEEPKGAFSRSVRRLYRVPVIGAIVYLLFPPRVANPSVPRRLLSWTSGLAAIIGLGMIAYPYAGHRYPFFLRIPVEKGIEWSNLFSDLETNRLQRELDERFRRMMAAQRMGLGEGDPLTRIRIPKIGLDTLVVHGTSLSALKAGAGHYPQTPLPGQRGNVGIAGHRTTHGRPFSKVDQLEPGDRIDLITPKGIHTYRVTKDPWVTHPRDWSVVEPSKEALLTLTTCNPKFNNYERLIVHAELVDQEPRTDDNRPAVLGGLGEGGG